MYYFHIWSITGLCMVQCTSHPDVAFGFFFFFNKPIIYIEEKLEFAVSYPHHQESLGTWFDEWTYPTGIWYDVFWLTVRLCYHKFKTVFFFFKCCPLSKNENSYVCICQVEWVWQSLTTALSRKSWLMVAQECKLLLKQTLWG